MTRILSTMDRVGAYSTDKTFLKASLTTQVVGFLFVTAYSAPEVTAQLIPWLSL